MDHSPGHNSDEDDRREYRRDKFKRERGDGEDRDREFAENSVSDPNYKRERFGGTPDDRGRKSQKFDDSYRGGRRPERSSFDSRESYGRDGRDGRDNRRYRDESPSARPERGPRRESPPFKRRKREDEWDERDRSPSPRRRAGRGGRSSWPEYDEYERERELRERDREREERYGTRGDEEDYYSGARTRASKGIRNNPSLFEGPMKSRHQFRDTQEEGMSSSELERRYIEYENEYKRRQLLVFFNEHKTDEWFKEKYEPSYLELKKQEKLQQSKQNVKEFAESLQKGVSFSLSAAEDTIKDVLKGTEFKDSSEPAEGEKMDDKAVSKEENGKAEEPVQRTDSAESSNILFIKVVPPFISRAEILEIFKKFSGFRKLSMSEPMRFKNFNRLGWATFDSVEGCQSALKELQGKTKIKDFELHMSINKTQDVHRVKLTPPVASEEARIKIDLEQSKLLSMQLDKEKGVEDNPALTASDVGLSNTEQLDRMIMYLRKVHFFCYYCGEEFDDEDELARKCDKHLRGRKKDSDMSIDVTTDQWALSLDTKIKSRINSPYTPDVYTGNQRIEKMLDKFYRQNVAKIEDEKFRCAVCNKLFMGENFVRKHLNLKHQDSVDAIKKKALEKQFFENYCTDPKRINPNPNMIPSTGTPRGGGGGGGGGVGRGRGTNMWNSPVVPYGNYFSPNAQTSYSYTPAGYRSSPRGGLQQGVRRGFSGTGTPQQRSPGFRMEPPPGFAPDPRSMRQYVDLDAPVEETVQIDYRTALDLHKELRKKEEQ